MEKAVGNDRINVGAQVPAKEQAHYKAVWRIYKFVGDYPGMPVEDILAAGVKPYDVLEFEGNCLLNDGINNIVWPAVAGASYTPINTTDGCIGVGDSNTAAVASQTGLQASTNRQWVIATSVTQGSSQQIVIQASFGSTYGNFQWLEICAGSTTTPGSLPSTGATPPATAHVLNRLVPAGGMGTKVSGTTWVATLTITLS